MPSELNIQAPEDIWRLIESLGADDEDKDEDGAEVADIPPSLNWFYGL